MAPAAKKRVVVVGAGLAGAAVARSLAAARDFEVVIIDKETAPGTHSSSRNAEMIRQIVHPPAIAALALEGARYCAQAGATEGRFRFRLCGSYLLGEERSLQSMLNDLTRRGLAPDGARLVTRDEVILDVEALHDAQFECALSSPNDGVVDAAGLLASYLAEARAAGARLRTQCAFMGVRSSRGRITAVRFEDGSELDADVVVNAAGPWAGRVGAAAGALPIRFRALRRHLFHTGPMRDVDPDWPFVWDVTHDWYLRPESGGLLLCAGDEAEVEPGIPDVHPGITALLHQKLDRHAPSLAKVPIARMWSGLRTFAPDRNFVIGADPKLEGFFWAAGLGGHGVTTSAAVGRLTAALVRGEGGDEWSAAFSPSRFEAALSR